MASKIACLTFLSLGAVAQILDDGAGQVAAETVLFAAGRAGAQLPPLKLLTAAFDSIVKTENSADEFVVFFCVSWLEECQDLRDEFRRRGTVLESQFNAQQIFAPKVRFAEVDCADDKVLCNRESVEAYPTIRRYVHGGSMTTAWEGRLGQKRPKIIKAMLEWMDVNVGKSVAPAVTEEPPSLDHFRWAARIGSFIALTVALAKIGFDILQSTLEAMRASAGGASAEEEQKQAALRERHGEASAARLGGPEASCRLSRVLPKAWAAERPQINL